MMENGTHRFFIVMGDVRRVSVRTTKQSIFSIFRHAFYIGFVIFFVLFLLRDIVGGLSGKWFVNEIFEVQLSGDVIVDVLQLIVPLPPESLKFGFGIFVLYFCFCLLMSVIWLGPAKVTQLEIGGFRVPTDRRDGWESWPSPEPERADFFLELLSPLEGPVEVGDQVRFNCEINRRRTDRDKKPTPWRGYRVNYGLTHRKPGSENYSIYNPGLFERVDAWFL